MCTTSMSSWKHTVSKLLASDCTTMPTIASGKQPLAVRTSQSLTPHSSASASRKEQRKLRAVQTAAPSGMRPMNALKEKANVKQKRLKSNTNGRDWMFASTGITILHAIQPICPYKHEGIKCYLKQHPYLIGLPKLTDKERIGAHASRPWDLGKYVLTPSMRNMTPPHVSVSQTSQLTPTTNHQS